MNSFSFEKKMLKYISSITKSAYITSLIKKGNVLLLTTGTCVLEVETGKSHLKDDFSLLM
jgi:hypothetical protein